MRSEVGRANVRRFTWFPLVVALVLLGGARPGPTPEHHVPLAAVPISRMDLPWWRERHEAVLQRLRQGKVDLIFLGDSITQDWEKHGPPGWQDFQPIWERFYGDRNAVNMGFTGDTTASLLWRIENGEVDGISPKVAVILIGANNLGRVHWSAEETVTGIDAIIKQLRRRLPRTRLLLLSVLPSERSAWASEQTVTINHLLAERYGDRGDVTFLDVTQVFMKNGRPDPDLYLDRFRDQSEPLLHPSAQGQERLAAFIEPTLATLMGDRNHLLGR
jgi:lysophospholipase L1-like esterase